jgi:uncharacterized protein
MSGSFELDTSKNGKFMFNLKAGNGQVILTSQMYETKPSALQGVESVKANAAIDERYERATTTAGEPYFNLKAANSQVIGRSQSYSSVASMEAGIASVKSHAPGAVLKDLTAE